MDNTPKLYSDCLMIGDWVLNKANRIPIKVDLGTLSVMREIENLPDGLEVDPYPPIPLTPEILKAWGFTDLHTGIQRYSLFQKNPYFSLVISESPFCDGYMVECDTNVILTYVNQLQQYLRLCGRYELAARYNPNAKEDEGK